MIVRRLAAASLALFALTTTACYHAVVETGRPASATVIDEPWAMSFLFGLVPPKAVNTASQCPNGVAKVETQHSFLNGLVASLTFGLLTPIQITVTCAGSGAGSDDAASNAAASVSVSSTASDDDKVAAFEAAARLSADRGEATYVRFE